jgi:hypothetical protein
MKRVLIAALTAVVAIAPGVALAKNPHGTPPGLANKPGGMPPGQYKKLYAKGDRLPLNYVNTRYYISDPNRYRLPPAPAGYRWVMVEDHAYMANTTTGLIANVIANILTR